jgi:hypothetical protein
MKEHITSPLLRPVFDRLLLRLDTFILLVEEGQYRGTPCCTMRDSLLRHWKCSSLVTESLSVGLSKNFQQQKREMVQMVLVLENILFLLF